MSLAIDRIIGRLIYEPHAEVRMVAWRYSLADLIRDLRDASEEHDYEIGEWQEEVNIALCTGEHDDGLSGGENAPAVGGRASGRESDDKTSP